MGPNDRRTLALMLTIWLGGGMLAFQLPELILASYRTIHFNDFRAIDLQIERIGNVRGGSRGQRSNVVVEGHHQGQVLYLRKSEAPEIANVPAPESMVGRTIRILYRPDGSMYRMNGKPLAVAPFRERRISFVADGTKALAPATVFGILAIMLHLSQRRTSAGVSSADGQCLHTRLQTSRHKIAAVMAPTKLPSKRHRNIAAADSPGALAH